MLMMLWNYLISLSVIDYGYEGKEPANANITVQTIKESKINKKSDEDLIIIIIFSLILQHFSLGLQSSALFARKIFLPQIENCARQYIY